MSTADSTVPDTRFTSGRNDEYQLYRAMSLSAVCAFMLAILSLLALLIPFFLVLPILGMCVGAYSLLKIRHRREEISGYRLAVVGTAVCALILASGSALWAYEIATEVPEGYQRLSWNELQPDDPRLPIPRSAMDLDGKAVFIKGYMYPGDAKEDLRNFVIVPDLGTCCFGGDPKLTHMVEVTLQDPHRIDYSAYRKRKLGGVLKVSPQLKAATGVDGVYYQLDANYVK